MKITEGLLPEDKEAIIRWTNSKGADFLQQWVGDALPYPLTIEALNALPHCFRIEAEGSFIGMIQQIRVEGSNVAWQCSYLSQCFLRIKVFILLA